MSTRVVHNELVSISRRGLVGAFATAGGLAAAQVNPASPKRVAPGLPAGAPLRIKPVLFWELRERKEFTSWRVYSGFTTRADVDGEARRIEGELHKLAARAEFPIDVQPVALVNNDSEAAAAKESGCDVFLLYAAGGPKEWLETVSAAGKPSVLFLRYKSGPLYLYYETAHYRFLRKSDDPITERNVTVDDIVADNYDEVLWRLRALYGWKNTRGTKSLAIGGIQCYSRTGTKVSPSYAKRVWNFDIIEYPVAALDGRLMKFRADANRMKQAQRQAEQMLAQPNVKLQTDRKFVVNSFVAAEVFKDVMRETGATNVGAANCLSSLMRLLDTPPCLVLSILNDEGYTAFCHADYTQTPPGVLLRWLSGKPCFISNAHFPHHGMLTIAHCSTPRKMDGKTYEPTTLMTHFESDYGAATRVEFRKGQVITNIIPNLSCTKWFGFKARILDTPSRPACRTQADIEILGDWQRLLREMEGIHTATCYGDYIREVGYVLKKVDLQWINISEKA